MGKLRHNRHRQGRVVSDVQRWFGTRCIAPLTGLKNDLDAVFEAKFKPLISGVAIGALLADKAFDNDWLRAELNRRGAIAVIPPKAS